MKSRIIKKGRITGDQRIARAYRAYRTKLRDDMRLLIMDALRECHDLRDPEARRVTRNRRKARARRSR